ncbi:MAG: hypothetical protein OEV92_12800, partial [Nitrospinota bacterium]|nr:hypothetical protein [Nitrospinota bacterium]
MKQSLAPILAVAVMLTCVSGALAQDIDAVRKDFDRTTGAALAQVQDMAAVEDVTSRLPGNRTLRQTVKLFAKNGKIRQEVEAIMKNGSRIKFLTIMADDEMWTLTPNGKMVKMEMAAHGGMRPDPLMKYLSISIKPGAKMAGKETWEGKDALVVDNGDGE